MHSHSKTIDQTKKFIKQVSSHKNTAAQKTLEDILKEKAKARIESVLADNEKQEKN